MAPRLGERSAGILVHPTSLPGPHGCGDIGATARAWIDFSASAAQSWWQMLPVGPLGYGNSPYSAQSAFAGNPLLVALDPLVERGWIDARMLGTASLPRARVDYPATHLFRMSCLREAAARFFARRDRDERRSFDAFVERERAWLDGFALFRAIKRAHDDVEWTRWPAPLRDRNADALARASHDLADEIAFEKLVQWIFDEQWRTLRAHAAARDVGLVGDVPIVVAHDSADVWEHRELFFLDDEGAPTYVAGVPPDYFSRTGQRWGNPLYRWRTLKRSGYDWWVRRMRSTLTRFDVARLDHFIGFQRYWRIPAREPNAVNGKWMKGPGADLFSVLERELGGLPLIAEDLGAITPSVKRLRDRLGLPGIRVLQFAFGTDPSAPDFLPHNHPRRAVVYTGTHDNDTTLGWFHDRGGEGARSPEQTEIERRAAMRYLGVRDAHEIHWDMIRAAYASVARTAIVPLQDVLGLGSEARMNHPGTLAGNWEWRFAASDLTPAIAERLADLARTYGRRRA